jgi:hypothetical protein
MSSKDFSIRDRGSDSSHHVRFREAKVRRRQRWGEDGVASTVGTIMALMVFMAFLSMFTSQYVPVWMEENEASHMSNAYGQFAALKQAIDMQILAGTIQGTYPVEMFSPIKLGAEGIPMFAAPTAGTLSIYRSLSFNNISFSYGSGLSNTTPYSTSAGGSIQLDVENRYYVEQQLIYENDALILKQPDGQYMRATPQFIVTPSGGSYHITMTQVDLRGDDANFIGFGTRGVKTIMRAATTTTYTNLTGAASNNTWIHITQATWYEQAWNTTFNQTLSSAGLVYGVHYFIESVPMGDTEYFDDFYEVRVRINPSVISRFSLTIANVEVSTSEVGAA